MKKIQEWYEKKYKLLFLIPALLLLFAFIQIGFQYATTGDFVHRGISLKGGSTITLPLPSLLPSELEEFLHSSYSQAEISVRTLTSAGKDTAVVIDSNIQDQAALDLLLSSIQDKTRIEQKEYSVEVIGSSLGEQFFRQTITALLLAFLLMAIVVFVYFRSFIPSGAVILAAFSDIIVTLAIFNLTGSKLSPGGVAAFLMLVGYSVDTDMLLSVRVLKRSEGTVMQRIYSSIKTGLTMTSTTIAAVLVAFIFVQSDTVRQIMLILLIGLFVDMIMTWIQNVGILRWYLEKKHV